MPRSPRTPKPITGEVLGLMTPVVAKGVEVKVSAWRDTDKPKGLPKYHLVVKPRGMPEHDFFAMSPAAIKDFADQLLDLHRQLAAPPASTQKIPTRK